MNAICNQCKVSSCEWMEKYAYLDPIDYFIKYVLSGVEDINAWKGSQGYKCLDNSCPHVDKLMLISKLRRV